MRPRWKVGGRARALLPLAVALAVSVVPTPSAQAPRGVETFDEAWRIIRDSHFDRTFNGLNWDAVAQELRPKAAAARNPGELRAVIRDMLGRLGQSHFALLPASADSADAPTAPPTRRRISAAPPASTCACSATT